MSNQFMKTSNYSCVTFATNYLEQDGF